MSKFNCFGREAPGLKFKKLCSRVNTYAEAVRVGQRQVGHGNFYVEAVMSSHVPSREEQLLQLPAKSERQRLLDAI